MSVAAIVNLVRATPALQGLSASALVSAINGKTIEQQDHTLRNINYVKDVISPQAAMAAALAFEQAIEVGSPLSAAQKAYVRLQQIGGAGIDLADATARALIDAMAQLGLLSVDLATAIKALGISYSSFADSIGGDVTQEQCEAALAEIAAEDAKASLLQLATTRWNNVLAAIGDGSIATEAEAIAIFGV